MSQSTLGFGNANIRHRDGLFSLHDLHKVSSGESQHQPEDTGHDL